MPTGYTASIKDGISFKDFVLQCARGMGACITMRDDPSDKEIPEKFEPTDYHQKKIKEAREELEALSKLSIPQANEKAKKEYERDKERYSKYIEDANDLRIKYKTMLIQVKDWQLPTPDHQGVKDFMIQQITSSIDFNCNTDYYHDELKKISLLTGQHWLEKENARLLKDLSYHIKEDMEEQERVAGRNKWIKALRESLV